MTRLELWHGFEFQQDPAVDDDVSPELADRSIVEEDRCRDLTLYRDATLGQRDSERSFVFGLPESAAQSILDIVECTDDRVCEFLVGVILSARHI